MPLALLLRVVVCYQNGVEMLTSPGGWRYHEAPSQLGLQAGGDISIFTLEKQIPSRDISMVCSHGPASIQF